MTLDKIIISSCDRYTYWSKHQVDSGPLCHHGQGYSCCQKSMLHWVPMFPLPQRGSIVTIGEMPSLVLMILIVRVNTHTRCLKDPGTNQTNNSWFSSQSFLLDTTQYDTKHFPFTVKMTAMRSHDFLNLQIPFFQQSANCKKLFKQYPCNIFN